MIFRASPKKENFHVHCLEVLDGERLRTSATHVLPFQAERIHMGVECSG
jgi:hypothetical protein